jgi:hypothetical protein
MVPLYLVIIFYALTFVLSYSLFIPELEILSSTLFFLLKTFFGKLVVAFFLFSNVVYISFLVFKSWLMVFVDFLFDAQINTKRFLQILR